jgi:hypothetical protein
MSVCHFDMAYLNSLCSVVGDSEFAFLVIL